MVLRTSVAGLLLLGALALPPASASVTAIVVDDDGVQCPDALPTLAAALEVAAATEGADEVRVCAGTYPEDVRVSGGGPVRITGDGRDVVRITGVEATTGPVVHADGERVDLTRLTVDGGGDMGEAGEEVHGVRFDGVGGSLDDVVVDGVYNADRTSLATAVTVRGGADVTITGAVLDGFAWRGVDAADAGTRLVLQRSSVVRSVKAPELSPTAVRVLDGASARVEDNRIGGVSVASVRGIAAAVDVQCPGAGTVVAGNEVVRSTVGVHVSDAEGVVVRDNVLPGPGWSFFNGILLRSQVHGVPECSSETLPPTRGNVVARNRVSGTTGAGIMVYGWDKAPDHGPLDTLVEENVVTDVGGIGIAISSVVDNHIVRNVIRRAGGRRGPVDEVDRALEDALGIRLPVSQSPDGWDDGLSTWRSYGNRFEGNDVRDSFDYDCSDPSPQRNTWVGNGGDRSRPRHICAP